MVQQDASSRCMWLTTRDHKLSFAPLLTRLSDAVTLFGCPDRQRSDNGSENALVWRLMARLRGDASVHRGPSPANIKTEHQWYFTRWNVLEVYREACDTFTTVVGDLPRQSESQTPRKKYVYRKVIALLATRVSVPR